MIDDKWVVEDRQTLVIKRSVRTSAKARRSDNAR
jgi:hypothetical protein